MNLNMIEKLLAKLRTLGPVTEIFAERVRSVSYIKKYNKGEMILLDNEVCKRICLIINGLTRSYYLNDGKDVTSRFMDEGFIVTSWISYYTQKPEGEMIEAAEDTILVCIDYADIQKMYTDFPESNIIGRRQVEYAFFLSEQRTQILRGNTATERYKFFIENHPSLLQRVPLKHIATYLGMSEETLSRVRSKFHKSH
jgi:CRP/FNR family transcriptional regulator, anaerobic regulatory protein